MNPIPRISNPYPSIEPRHVIQTYIGQDDWEFFEAQVRSTRGVAANVLAIAMKNLVAKLRAANLQPQQNEPEIHQIITRFIQGV